MTDPPKDKRPYFVLTNEYPRHRKIRGLSDKAFRLHVTLMGLCNEDRNDGILFKHDFEQFGPKVAKELLAADPGRNPLAYKLEDGTYRLHDYLKHQNSADEIAVLTAQNKEAGALGGKKSAHTRWHVNRGLTDDNCEFCKAETG